MMKLVRDQLCPGTIDSNITIRLDGAKAHSSAATVEALKRENLTVEIHESQSRSKNQLPELDARIEKLSRYLTNFMTEDGIYEAARKAI